MAWHYTAMGMTVWLAVFVSCCFVFSLRKWCSQLRKAPPTIAYVHDVVRPLSGPNHGRNINGHHIDGGSLPKTNDAGESAAGHVVYAARPLPSEPVRPSAKKADDVDDASLRFHRQEPKPMPTTAATTMAAAAEGDAGFTARPLHRVASVFPKRPPSTSSSSTLSSLAAASTDPLPMPKYFAGVDFGLPPLLRGRADDLASLLPTIRNGNSSSSSSSLSSSSSSAASSAASSSHQDIDASKHTGYATLPLLDRHRGAALAANQCDVRGRQTLDCRCLTSTDAAAGRPATYLSLDKGRCVGGAGGDWFFHAVRPALPKLT